jgi:hypothetical protein
MNEAKNGKNIVLSALFIKKEDEYLYHVLLS